MRRSKSRSQPRRGEVWRIRFDPSMGSETRKTRPAVVVSLPSVGRLPLGAAQAIGRVSATSKAAFSRR